MGETTGISWADSTLNIWLGCTKVSNGAKGACEGCYAQVLVEERFGRAAWGPHAERIETKGWRAQLRKISRMALAAGRPWFVFVNSLSDFWDNQADPALRREALDEFQRHPHVTFLLLTKRPQNIVKLFADTLAPTADKRDTALREAFPRNCAIGCTIVTQAEAERDVPVLLAAKAALNPAFAFVSMEPLMERVDLTRLRLAKGDPDGSGRNALHPAAGLDWVITGGETDQGKHKARPSHPDWFRSLRDQCAAAGVAFHHKQNGEWASHRPQPGGDLGGDMRSGKVVFVQGDGRAPDGHFRRGDAVMAKLGKKAAGRALDGVIHDARPVV